jgi:hypothetical protein
MPYPMIPGTIKEKWEKSIENSIGLPIDLIRKMDSTHMSFYLQNKDAIEITENKSGEIEYIIKEWDLIIQYYSTKHNNSKIKEFMDIINQRTILSEKEFDDYLNIIDFRGPEIGTDPMQRYITSEQIDKEMDKYFKDNSKD